MVERVRCVSGVGFARRVPTWVPTWRSARCSIPNRTRAGLKGGHYRGVVRVPYESDEEVGKSPEPTVNSGVT